MSFSLVHFTVHLFLYSKQGSKLLDIFSDGVGSTMVSNKANDANIELSYSFSNQSSPSDTSITIHNLTKSDYSKFKKGCTVSIYAGWWSADWSQNNVDHIFTSTIDTVGPLEDSSGDWQTSITFKDGQKFDNETALSKIYKNASKSVRKNASGLGRDAISRITKLFKGKRNALSNYLKGKRATIKGSRAAIQKQKHAIMTERHSYVEKFKNERASIKGKRGGAAKAIRAKIQSEAASVRSKLSDEDHNLTEASKLLSNKSSKISANGTKSKRKLQKQERHKKTQARVKEERSKRAKNKKKTKSQKTKKSGLHFKKNTKALTIIKKLAKIGHIPIHYLKLVHNKKYTSGYTATGKPFAEIKNIVQDCDSNIWWPHGDLYIGNFAKHKKLNFTLTPDTGLIQTPTKQDDDDSDDDEDSSTKTKDYIAPYYEASSVFLPFLTTGAKFDIEDPDKPLYALNAEPINAGELFKGTIVVTSGTLNCSPGEMPSADITFQLASDVNKAQKQKNKTKQQKKHESEVAKKSKKDRKIRHKAKARRVARRSPRHR